MAKRNAQAHQSHAPLDKAVKDLAEIRARQLEALPRSQIGIEWLTDRIGRPWFAYAIVIFIAAWIACDLAFLPRARFDAPTFPLLQLLLSILALLMAIFILITENRQGEIAEKRAQLTLQLSLANEERAAKIIQLLEELRKDDPLLPDRHDEQAQEMSEAIDLHTAIDKMEDANERISERRD
jgi:uncharacterized membrane protein